MLDFWKNMRFPPPLKIELLGCLVLWEVWSNQTVPVGLVVSEARDAFPQDEQRVVDVAGLLQPLPDRLGFVAALRAGQVAQRKPENAIQVFLPPPC